MPATCSTCAPAPTTGGSSSRRRATGASSSARRTHPSPRRRAPSCTRSPSATARRRAAVATTGSGSRRRATCRASRGRPPRPRWRRSAGRPRSMPVLRGPSRPRWIPVPSTSGAPPTAASRRTRGTARGARDPARTPCLGRLAGLPADPVPAHPAARPHRRPVLAWLRPGQRRRAAGRGPQSGRPRPIHLGLLQAGRHWFLVPERRRRMDSAISRAAGMRKRRAVVVDDSDRGHRGRLSPSGQESWPTSQHLFPGNTTTASRTRGRQYGRSTSRRPGMRCPAGQSCSLRRWVDETRDGPSRPDGAPIMKRRSHFVGGSYGRRHAAQRTKSGPTLNGNPLATRRREDDTHTLTVEPATHFVARSGGRGSAPPRRTRRTPRRKEARLVTQINLTVNGQRQRGGGRAATDARPGAARRPRPDRHPRRLRHEPVRRMHRPRRWRRRQVAARCWPSRPTAPRHDDRGPGPPIGTLHPLQAGVLGEARPAVRLLHARA